MSGMLYVVDSAVFSGTDTTVEWSLLREVANKTLYFQLQKQH